MKKTPDFRFTPKRLTTPTGRPVTIRQTKFQEAILAWIDLLGVATVDQLAPVLGRKTVGERNYLYRILRKLFNLNLVAKEPFWGKDVYFLPQNPVKNLAHAVGVSEVVTRFALAFKAEGFKVNWVKDQEPVEGVLPDAWALGEKPNVITWRLFCFEFQRSKKSLAEMKRKVAAYDQAEAALEQKFQVGAVYRLFIVVERFDAFSHQVVRKVGRSAHDYCFVTSDEYFKATKPEKLLITPIWWQGYEPDQVSLFVKKRSP
jgi:hypothetical protein